MQEFVFVYSITQFSSMEDVISENCGVWRYR
jgi:hypothetical protein